MKQFGHFETRRMTLPKFLIEREIPAAGNFSPSELQAISQTSCGVLQKVAPRSSGYIATSPATKCIAFTSRRTKRWS